MRVQQSLVCISHQPGTSRNSVPLLRQKQCCENSRENTASSEAVAHRGEKCGLGAGRHQRRRSGAVEMCKNSRIEKVEHAAALLDAGGDHRPGSLTPALARFAARALGDAPVDDHEADRLFGQVVGRLDAGCGDESEVGLPACVFCNPSAVSFSA